MKFPQFLIVLVFLFMIVGFVMAMGDECPERKCCLCIAKKYLKLNPDLTDCIYYGQTMGIGCSEFSWNMCADPRCLKSASWSLPVTTLQ